VITPISAAATAALRRAQQRLLASRPTASDGRLTVSNLAREAGVSRATAYRASAIVEEFQSLAAQHRSKAKHPTGSRRQHIAALEALIVTLRQGEREEIRTLRARTGVLAQHIQALTMLTHELDRQIAALSTPGSRANSLGVVVPIGRKVSD